MKVVEAMRENGVAPLSHRAVEVAFTPEPAYVSGVQAKAAPLPALQGAVVIEPSVFAVRQPEEPPRPETIRLVEEAVEKYPVPDTESAVEEA